MTNFSIDQLKIALAAKVEEAFEAEQRAEDEFEALRERRRALQDASDSLNTA